MPRRPLDAFIYYLDANLDGPELVGRLREAGMPCEPHRSHFAPDAEDELWIPAVASRGWIIVTRDFAIQRRPPERQAWIASNAIVVMIRGERLSADDMSKRLLAAHANRRLDSYIAKRSAPMIIYLGEGGQLRTHLGGARRGGRKRG
jgi:hypothetical protein